MTLDEIKELRRLAEAAKVTYRIGDFYLAVASGMNAATSEWFNKANPTAILSLLDRVGRLEAVLTMLERAATTVSNRGATTGPQWVKLSAAIMSARAALEDAP